MDRGRNNRPDVRDIFPEEGDSAIVDVSDEVIVHDVPDEDIPVREMSLPPVEVSPSTTKKVAQLQEMFSERYANGRLARKALQQRFDEEEKLEEEEEKKEEEKGNEEGVKGEEEKTTTRKWYSKFRTLPRYTSAPKKSDR